jgi:hypothetical protein
VRSCDPQELELPALFYIYFNTHGVLLRVRVGARGLLFTRFFIFCFFLMARHDWAIQRGLSG